MLAVWKQTKRKPKRLNEIPKLPELFAHLWEYYTELNGAEALTFSEIESWSRITKRNIESYEALILKRLDSIYLKVIHG